MHAIMKMVQVETFPEIYVFDLCDLAHLRAIQLMK